MKKTLAIILSIVMLFSMVPFAVFAADADTYERGKVAANDEAYIEAMSAEQMAAVILDWVDRKIADYSAEFKDAVTGAVLENGGFEEFEAFLGKDALGNIIAENVPDITSLDSVIAYKDYLKELGGDFAGLDATNLITREEAGSAIGFVNGVFQFMADNSETFGKVFRWDGYVVDEAGAVTDYGNVFDYGKVGDYIETLNGSENADEQAIYDFYINYLVGNDIQAGFVNWIANQMNYTPADGETFDEVLDNGIMAWFSGLCEKNGILSAEGLETLRAYDLKTTNIYKLVKDFVALVESDNQVKIDTYYNYLLDTVVRTLIKTMLGQKAVVGAAAEVPAGFKAIYTDLALLEEISGGSAYYYDGKDYYQVTIADGALSANALTWEAGFEMNLEPIYATILTGKDAATTVQTYEPKSTDISVSTYTTEKNLEYVKSAGLEVTGTEIPADIKAVMTEKNAKALSECFGLKVTQGEEEISKLVVGFDEIVTATKNKAMPLATAAVAAYSKDVTIKDINFNIVYNGYATEDEFVVEVSVSDLSVVLEKTEGSTMSDLIFGIAQSAASSAVQPVVESLIDLPIATIVVDDLSGGGADYFGQAEALLDFVKDDFVVDQALLDFSANYDKYHGVVGQVNRVLVGLVKMFINEDLGLKEGGNEYLTDNLQTLCDKVNAMMEAANDLINNEDLQGMIKELGIDFDALTKDIPLDLLYSLDFSSVEALWVTVITLGLDFVDDGTNEVVTEIHALIGDLANLDAMAVAVADYALAECIPALNKAFADNDFDFALTVPAKTDAAAVADGAGKDIIMTKLVDLAYEAAVEGVALVNVIANQILAKATEETGMELPTVAFELKVEKGADWEATLAALVDRAYELADGIIIACDVDTKPADTFDAISKVVNAILPLGSLASNCAANGYAFDINTVMGYLFDDALEGDLDGFLRLFETAEKTEDVAATCSVTEALINASEHIVDAFFPDTVKADLYVGAESEKFTQSTVQEYFTSAENDQLIASNNMDSINARKAELVPAVLNLVREAGVLPFFAKCDKEHTKDTLKLVDAGAAATCSKEGHEALYKCDDCGYELGGAIIPKNNNHVNKVDVKAQEATCTAKGYTAGVYCNDCKKYISGHTEIGMKPHSYGAWTVVTPATCTEEGSEQRVCACKKAETRAIAATGHVDADNNNACDVCGAQIKAPTFFDQIRAFFQRIIDWFKNLFKFG